MTRFFQPYGDLKGGKLDEAIVDDFIDLFDSERGRRVLTFILQKGALFHESDGAPDFGALCVMQGRRDMALMIARMAGVHDARLSAHIALNDWNLRTKDNADE